MKRGFLKIIIFFWISFVVNSSLGQEPNWTFNALEFQHSMTFTTFLNVDGITLSSENDKVAAFIDGELRGVTNVTYIASRNKYVAYLSVFANSNSKAISFKIYDSTNDRIVEISKTETFEINGNLGGIFQSYSIASPQLNNEATLNDFNFKDIIAVSKSILGNSYNFVLPQTTNIINLVPEFTIDNGAKVYLNKQIQISEVSNVDFSNSQLYQVLSEDESVLKEYQINVSAATSQEQILATLSTNSNFNSNSRFTTVNLHFSNEIIGLETEDFLLTNAVITNLKQIDNQNYELQLIAINEGIFSVQLKENSVLNVDNNPNKTSNLMNFIFDETRPIMSSLEFKTAVGGEFFTIIFNEDVINVDSSDFKLTGTISSTYEKSSLVQISEKEYRLNVNKSNTDLGSIYLKLTSDSDIEDLSKNKLIQQEVNSFYLDNQLPILPVLNDITAECSIIVSEIPKANDLVSGEIIGTTTSTLSYSEQGEYSIIWSFDDGNGNIATANQKVIIKDEIAPTILAKDITLELDINDNAVLEYQQIDEGSTDNCGIDSYNLSKTNFNIQDLGENNVTYKITDVNGNSAETNIKVTITQNSLSVKDITADYFIRIYPNPVINKIFFKFENTLKLDKVEVFSISGKKLIVRENVINFVDINILSKGFYLVKITTDKNSFVKQFLKI